MTDNPFDKRPDESIHAPNQEPDQAQTLAFSHHDYAVGWICALPIEQTAAIAMLDAIHPSLTKPPSDHNTYTLGRSGKHNVVIACLPKGQYATIPAAKVATWMMGTFPSVRFGLMVGIGAGLPSKVSLGDVVLSTPMADHSGVVQWDLGKAEDGGRFKRTGALSPPPTALLTALTKMESQHALEGSKICHYLDQVRERRPRLKSKLDFPEQIQDHLTVPGNLTSTQAQRVNIIIMFWMMIMGVVSYLLAFFTFRFAATDAKTLVKSFTSTDKTETMSDGISKEPRVHYGLVVSGNQVVKDASVRDRLDQDLGGQVLCIEMEAAGLMNDFPCIVIRGICDFADANKTKVWQDYAAMVAAGCAKELLEFVDLNDVKQTPEARLVMQTLQDITSTTKSIAQKQEQQMQTEEQRTKEAKWQKLSNWLSPLIPSARHTENQKQRVNGTGSWLLGHPTLREWMSPTATHQIVWCFGDPGAGKTIITSLVIDTLEKSMGEEPRTGTGYVYCDYRDRNTQTVVNVLGTIARQLLRRLVTIPPAVWQLYQKDSERDGLLSSVEAQRLLRLVSAEFDKIYICIDALDEFNELQNLLGILRERPSNVQLFLTGRPHIQDTVHRYLPELQALAVVAHESDIKQFIDCEIGGPSDAEPDAMNDELRTSIQQKICDSSKGVFLLPVLQIRAVLENLTIRERERSLERLPSNLGEAFAGSFVRIQSQSRPLADRAARIVALVYLAQEPLKIDELLCFLSIQKGDTSFDPKSIPVRKTLLNCCHGLVTVDQETSFVRLVHFSLQEHLQRQSEIFGTLIAEWHRCIAIVCLTFLRFYPRSDTEECHIAEEFWRYAVLRWGDHLRDDENTPDTVYELIEEYYDICQQSDTGRYQLERLGYRMSDKFYARTQPDDIKPLSHIAAYFGLPKLLSYLAMGGASLDTQDETGKTPLSWAVAYGRVEVVRWLLTRTGLDVNPKDRSNWNSTPLHKAAKQGDSEVVKLLLAHPAIDVNALYNENRSPLQVAVEEGHGEIVRLLLTHPNIEVNREGRDFSLLMEAADRGHGEVVQLLLALPKIEVNQQSFFGHSPLALAAQSGHSKVVEILLGLPNIQINTQEAYGSTPLHSAASIGYISVAELLLARSDIEVNMPDDEGLTPLSRAARRRQEATNSFAPRLSYYGGRTQSRPGLEDQSGIVRLLLAHPKVEVNTRDRQGLTPLSWAALQGQSDVVKLLLAQSEVDVNLRNDLGRTPLSQAVMQGRNDAVELLLAHPEVDVNAQDTHGLTPLSWAVIKGHRHTVEPILGHPKVEVDIQDNHKRTPLWWAVTLHRDEENMLWYWIIELLLEHNATLESDVDMSDIEMHDSELESRDESSDVEHGNDNEDDYCGGFDHNDDNGDDDDSDDEGNDDNDVWGEQIALLIKRVNEGTKRWRLAHPEKTVSELGASKSDNEDKSGSPDSE